MDLLVSQLTQFAFNHALKQGSTAASNYLFKQGAQLLSKTPKSSEREQIARLQTRLETKIRIISPSIDKIELISARGNTSLETALNLTHELRASIHKLGSHLNRAVEGSKERNGVQYLRAIISGMTSLIEQIDDAVPLLNLALTTSGANLPDKSTISLSRLLQASTFLLHADAACLNDPTEKTQVGPTFVATLYMLFASHALRPENDAGLRETTWKEVIHKAQVKLLRLPLGPLQVPMKQTPGTTKPEVAHFAYRLSIVEDFDDGRYHAWEDGENRPTPFDGIQEAGIRESISVNDISKIFYADTGALLNIESDSSETRPVLLLKRDSKAVPLSHQNEYMEEGVRDPPADSSPIHTSRWRFPAALDPEWIALEVYEAPLAVGDSETEDDSDDDSESSPQIAQVFALFNKFGLTSSPMSPKSSPTACSQQLAVVEQLNETPPLKTTLSLLEMLLKLAALQQFRQESHLAIGDELLTMFLEETSTAARGQDKTRRHRVRHDAVQRVGFDPYDDSPIKMRKTSKQVAGTDQRVIGEASRLQHTMTIDAPGFQTRAEQSAG